MIKTMSKAITEFLISQKVIKEEVEIYQYGFELIISSVMGFIGIFIISLYLDIVVEGIIYAISFYFIRKYTGGFHCKTYFTCILSFSIIFILYHFINVYTNLYFSIFVLIVSFGLIWVLAPCDHDNKKFSGHEKLVYQRISRKIITVVTVFVAFLYIFTQEFGIANSIANVVGIISILLVVGKIERRFESNEII